MKEQHDHWFTSSIPGLSVWNVHVFPKACRLASWETTNLSIGMGVNVNGCLSLHEIQGVSSIHPLTARIGTSSLHDPEKD